MNRKALSAISVIIFIFSLSIVYSTFPVEAVTPGETFDIYISIINIHNLYGLDLKLYYNTACLDLVEAAPKPLWKPNMIVKNEINDVEGIYRLVMVGSTPANPFDGSATLATLTFQRIGDGEGDFRLADTILSDPKGNPILHTTDGYVIYGVPVHDVAVTSIKGYPRGVIQGNPVFANVTVENQGNFAETFDVTLYADRDKATIGDEVTIGTQTVHDLPATTSQILHFVWDTTDVPYGAYFLSAKASIVPEEIDTQDNFLKASEYIGGIYAPPSVRRTSELLTQFTWMSLVAVLALGGMFEIKRYWFP